MHLNVIRYALVALSVLGSATLLSCNDDPKPTVYDLESLMTESSECRTITMVENGQRTYSFYAPLVEGYSMRKEPFQEFRRGIKLTTYTSDSLSLVNATIKANYAIYYETQKLWEAKGDVVIHRFNRKDGDTAIDNTTEIYTQQLFWNATTKKIYSNLDTKVLQNDGWHFGVGFDADEDLKNIHFRKYSSEVEFEMGTPKPRDSVAMAESAPDATDEEADRPKTSLSKKPGSAAKRPSERSLSKSETPAPGTRLGDNKGTVSDRQVAPKQVSGGVQQISGGQQIKGGAQQNIKGGAQQNIKGGAQQNIKGAPQQLNGGAQGAKMGAQGLKAGAQAQKSVVAPTQGAQIQKSAQE